MTRPRFHEHRLIVWHDKREGLSARLSPRFTDATLRFILMSVFSDDVLKELTERGFDVSTLRFTIDRSADGIAKIKEQRRKSAAS